MENNEELGLYIHIPFCIKKCKYCDFVSFSNKMNIVEEYIEVLKQEIEKAKIENKKITTIYFGGGTPSAIDAKYIQEILDKIRDKWNIENAEITIEVNPGTVDVSKLEDYLKMGINRLSIGLQSTSNMLLKLIGRIHTYEEFLSSYEIARKVGFSNINVDLMIGLPTQNLTDVEEDLKKILELNPEHISIYSLIIEANTPIEKEIKEKRMYLPSEDAERKMYWKVKENLEQSGYIHYEISNFSKPNYMSKHNSNCWNQKEYIGFGLAAHSYINGERKSNTENLEEYILQKGAKKTVHEKQDIDAMQKEFMMLGLRKIEGVSISDFKNKFVENPIFIFRQELDTLVKQELIEIEEDNIKLTNKGIDFANVVWEQFV